MTKPDEFIRCNSCGEQAPIKKSKRVGGVYVCSPECELQFLDKLKKGHSVDEDDQSIEHTGLPLIESMDLEKAARENMELGPSYICPNCDEEYDISLDMRCDNCGEWLEEYTQANE